MYHEFYDSKNCDIDFVMQWKAIKTGARAMKATTLNPKEVMKILTEKAIDEVDKSEWKGNQIDIKYSHSIGAKAIHNDINCNVS